MAKNKFYAVLRGRTPGIYNTWAECEKQVKGFQNAAFKSFPTVAEALEWINNGGTELKKSEEFDVQTYFNVDHLDTNTLPPAMPEAYAFVDGSYNASYNGKAVYGYGGMVHINGQEVYIQGNGCEEEYVVSHQIPGEVFGSIAAIEKAIELGAEHIVIFYDYAGIGHWATSGKRWKAEKPIAKEYVRRYDELSKKIRVNFYHVKAHSQIEGNEMVDKMAKQAVGLS